MDDLSALKVARKSGREHFTIGGRRLGHKLSEFWSWSVSDLVSNATRGRLAEFIVALALGVDLRAVRDEWQAYDLTLPDKTTIIEVKSAAYIQSWNQKRHSPIVFSVKRSLAWDRESNVQAKVATRQAKFYVFALLAHSGSKRDIDPMNLDQWTFYVVPTAKLDARQRSQHSITLASLEKLATAVPFQRLRDELVAAKPAGTGRNKMSVKDIARAWLVDPTRPRAADAVLHGWDGLVAEWLGDKQAPLLLRQDFKGRRGMVLHSKGRDVVHTDNSPANWALSMAIQGVIPTLDQCQAYLRAGTLPIAFTFATAEKSKAQFRGVLGSMRTPPNLNKHGWKVCHIDAVAEKPNPGNFDVRDLRSLKAETLRLLSPSNMFLVHLKPGGGGLTYGLGDHPDFIKVFREARDGGV